MVQHKLIKDPKTGRFKKGNVGGGRPKGSRSKIGAAFFDDLYEDWLEHGADTIRRVRQEKPDQYLRTVAVTLPQQIEVTSPEKELSDEQLAAALDALNAVVAITGGPSATESGPTRENSKKASGRSRAKTGTQ